MTVLRERPVTEITRTPTRTHATERVVGSVGLVAAALGAWMYYVPADWFLGGLAEDWYLGMFTGAGALLAAAFGLFASKVRTDEARWTTAATTAALAGVLALAAAVTFAVIWII